MRKWFMDRGEVEIEIAKLRAKFKVARSAYDKLPPHPNPRDPEVQKLEQAYLIPLRALREMEATGVVPWLEEDGLSSKDDAEIWAARVMASSYEYDDSDYRSATKVWEKTMLVTFLSSGYRNQTRMTHEQATELRDQLAYELERWESA